MIVYWLRHRGTAYPVHRGECIVGRAPHCFMVLSAEQVSREHAVVRLVGDSLELEELSSRNGTRVNGALIEGTRRLEPGDVIDIGGERLEVMRRVSRDQTATEQIEPPEDPSTEAQRNILELVEELMPVFVVPLRLAFEQPRDEAALSLFPREADADIHRLDVALRRFLREQDGAVQTAREEHC